METPWAQQMVFGASGRPVRPTALPEPSVVTVQIGGAELGQRHIPQDGRM